ncbi:MAG: nucleotidyltransferase domain-containing protein [Nanoarchaeota archaeon]
MNKNVLKILEVLGKGKNYFSQIHELSGIKSKNNLLRNLTRMTELNVVKKEKGKGNTHYSVNYESSLALILLQVGNVVRMQKLPFERRKAIEEIVKVAKPLFAVLFGSSAKGNFKKDSDVDLLLVYDKEARDVGKEAKDIGSKYGVKLRSTVMGFDELDTKDETLKHILKTGYPVTGHDYFYGVYKGV